MYVAGINSNHKAFHYVFRRFLISQHSKVSDYSELTSEQPVIGFCSEYASELLVIDFCSKHRLELFAASSKHCSLGISEPERKTVMSIQDFGEKIGGAKKDL